MVAAVKSPNAPISNTTNATVARKNPNTQYAQILSTFLNCAMLSKRLFCQAHSFPFKPNQIFNPKPINQKTPFKINNPGAVGLGAPNGGPPGMGIGCGVKLDGAIISLRVKSTMPNPNAIKVIQVLWTIPQIQLK